MNNIVRNPLTTVFALAVSVVVLGTLLYGTIGTAGCTAVYPSAEFQTALSTPIMLECE